jgi:uncharacterized membrane protein
MLFSRLLSWLLARFETLVIATMCGFLMGSLSIIWPWKLVTSSMTTESGKDSSAIHRQSYALRVFRAYRWRSTNRVMRGHVRVRFECR